MDHSEHPGMPARPPASAQLSINSVDRYANQTNQIAQYAIFEQPSAQNNPASNYQMTLARPLLAGYFTRIAVSQVQLQWNIQTVTTGYNDQLILYDVSNNQYYTVTITQNFYNAYTLAAAIQNAVQAIGAPWTAFTCVYDPVLTRLVMASNVGGLTFRLVTPAFIPGPPVVPANTRVNNFYAMIGVVYLNASFSLTTHTLGPLRLVPTSYIDICSTKLTQYMRVKDSETSFNPDTAVLCRVYMTPPNQRTLIDPSGNLPGSQPFTLVWDPNTPKHIKWEPNQYIYDFDIQVKDEFGGFVPWTPKNPFEFQMTLLASET